MTDTCSLPTGDLAFVSPKELARHLRVSIDCIYRLVAKRALPAYRVLRRILFRRVDVERWLAAHRTDPRDPELWR
ncbi:MAG: helix-turn-helix domain-containing protein [Deltaproteobacteria bacterium]|nr:helix-turn-helix domain-containing protein [Deltaproteobacteria bacterium]